MEYSTDSGETWITYNTLAAPTFSGAQTILVRFKAVDDTPAGEATTLIFTVPLAPAAPNVTADDTANTIVGANDTMEYSADSGETWTTYNTAAKPTFSGAQTILVRFKAVFDTPAGSVTILTFTASAPSTTGGEGGYVPQSNSQNISSANGGVFENEGAKVEVPAGAFPHNFKIMINKVSDPSALPVNEKSQRVGEVYEITKDQSGNFDKLITITLPYDKNKVDLNTQELGIFWFNETTKQWVQLENIKVDSNGGTVSGQVSQITKFVIFAVEKEVAPTVDPIEQKPVIEFSDTQGHWAEQAIRDLVSLDAINGFSDGTFKPNTPITRAEFTSILVKALGFTCETGKIFSDTKDHWAQACISTAEANGLVTGLDADKFGPDDSLTREQMAVIVARAAKLDVISTITTFSDDNRISTWAKPAVAAVAWNQLVTGLPNGTFNPQGKATRAEAAVVILRLILSAEA